jgi:acetyl esterase/lipase
LIAIAGVPLTPVAADDEASTIRVPAFDLPRYSDYMGPATRAGMERMVALGAKAEAMCNPREKTTAKEIRACEAIMYRPIVAAARDVYDVEMESDTIGGVYVDIVSPAEGLPPENERRVLINVHGGAFMYGARYGGQLEAMPLAATGKFKVIAVDYRMAPDHSFPAASVDIAAVYEALLQDFDPGQIGIYGCSAGGRIAGQTIAWMARQKLPNPGALAIQCSPPTDFGGDSNVIVPALAGSKPLVRKFEGYFDGVRPGDPVAFPGDFDEVLARFPPTLLMTSTRDYSLSPAVNMHRRLVRQGIETELHLFDGFGHAGFLNMYVPEAAEAARILARFFDKHLDD